MTNGEDRTPVGAARARLLALAAAHNKAVLAGVVAGLVLGLAIVAAALFLALRATPLVAPPLLALAALVLWRAVRLQRRVIRDLGPGRQAAAALVAALGERGGAAPLADLERAFSREDLLRALDFLGRLGIAWAERGPEGDVVRLDLARFDNGAAKR